MTKSKTKLPYKTREEWLEAGIDEMRPWFKEQGHPIPDKVKVSCGFVKGGGDKGIGQCFDSSCTDDGTTHMFICPTQSSPVRVLDILLHELIHAAVGTKEGHKGEFKKLAKAFGLAGKMTATYAEEGSELQKKLLMLSDRLGAYPHSGLKPMPKKGKGGNGWIRLKSITEAKYKVVISEKQFEEHGAPTDPWGEEMIPNDQEPEAGEDEE